MERDLQKILLIYFNFLMPHDLWQVSYQVLSITFLMEFIELHVN